MRPGPAGKREHSLEQMHPAPAPSAALAVLAAQGKRRGGARCVNAYASEASLPEQGPRVRQWQVRDTTCAARQSRYHAAWAAEATRGRAQKNRLWRGVALPRAGPLPRGPDSSRGQRQPVSTCARLALERKASRPASPEVWMGDVRGTQMRSVLPPGWTPSSASNEPRK